MAVWAAIGSAPVCSLIVLPSFLLFRQYHHNLMAEIAQLGAVEVPAITQLMVSSGWGWFLGLSPLGLALICLLFRSTKARTWAALILFHLWLVLFVATPVLWFAGTWSMFDQIQTELDTEIRLD